MAHETFELYVKRTSNCDGAPLTFFKRLSPMYKANRVRVRFDLEHGKHAWYPVVGWTDLYGGSATQTYICWVENSGQVGVLVYGGNSGVRVLDRSVKPIPGINEHLPRGFGQPWIWLAGATASQDLPEQVVRAIGERPKG